MPADETAACTRPLRLVACGRGCSQPEPAADLNAAGRHRLATAGAHCGADLGIVILSAGAWSAGITSAKAYSDDIEALKALLLERDARIEHLQ
ncbi:protein of unknown function (plasmid) [Cupriavidus taiwanensis]|uniref:Uncharacterized protein n=1 Tax=Cupriavidus taiwanensis TaxID=164546 RepID=A0A375EBP4_9BURK|nr:protein of unknown function [Cupriavidus taiwanensis]